MSDPIRLERAVSDDGYERGWLRLGENESIFDAVMRYDSLAELLDSIDSEVLQAQVRLLERFFPAQEKSSMRRRSE